jgi:protocatechuate 3,4-dioxygenase beta subunit
VRRMVPGVGVRLLTLATVTVALGGCRIVRELSNVQPVSLTTGIVSGHILDDRNGRPVPDAAILLLDANGDSLRDDQQHESRANHADGAYRFISVRPGTYRLRALAPGFDPSTSIEFAVTVNAITAVDLRLRLRANPN